MPRPVTEPRPLVHPRPRASRRAGVAAAALLAVMALAATATAMQAPALVDEVTVVNDSPFDVHVEVRPPDGPVLGLGTVPRERDIRFTSVLDQGETWAFTFSSGGEDAGTVEVPRSALERDGWRLTVPATATARLEQSDLPAAPETRTAAR